MTSIDMTDPNQVFSRLDELSRRADARLAEIAALEAKQEEENKEADLLTRVAEQIVGEKTTIVPCSPVRSSAAVFIDGKYIGYATVAHPYNFKCLARETIQHILSGSNGRADGVTP